MNSYQETILQLSEMKSRYDSGFSSSDRQVLESLHRSIFGKGITNKGCSDCYRDAYIIIVNHLKQTKTMPSKPNYILKAGAIIHPAGTSKFYSNPLPSDDIAEEHLSKFPNEIIKFAYFPEDWEDRVAAYIVRKKSAEAEKEAQADKAKEIKPDPIPIGATDALNAELAKVKEELTTAETAKAKAEEQVAKLESEKAELVAIVDELRAALAEPGGKTEEDSEEAMQLKMELETAKAELESAKEDIDKLKTENRALKAANTRLKNNGAKDTE